MYRLVITKSAAKTLRKLPRNLAKRIRQKLEELAKDPYTPNNNVTKLQNRPGFRLRVGDWRVIYEIEDDRLVILVLEIGPRGGIY
ncbi:MAG TPA: type II toxin-antitoxin system RelE/ParE family toxin [Anaerolineae bacterium]